MFFKIIEVTVRDCLKQTLKQVKSSLTKNLKTREKWILEWPGQLCIAASQVNQNEQNKHNKLINIKYNLDSVDC